MTCKKTLCAALLLLLTTGLVAQESNSRVSLFGSASLLQGERRFTLFGEEFRSKYFPGAKVGARGTIDLSDKWSFEAGYRYGSNTLEIIEELGTPTAETRRFAIRQHQLTASVLRLLNNRTDRVEVFVAAGGGLVRFSPTDRARARAAMEFVNNPSSDARAENNWNFHFGMGLEAKLTQSWGLRIDIQDHISPVPRYGLPESNPGGGADFYPVSGVMHDIEPSMGIVFRW